MVLTSATLLASLVFPLLGAKATTVRVTRMPMIEMMTSSSKRVKAFNDFLILDNFLDNVY